MLSISSSDNTYPQTWNIGNLVFCSQDLGSINFDIETVGPSLLNITSHGAGSSGIEFEYLAQWSLQNFNYDAIILIRAQVHLMWQASISHRVRPVTRKTLPRGQFSGKFRIGDIVGGNIPVGSDPATRPRTRRLLMWGHPPMEPPQQWSSTSPCKAQSGLNR